MIDPFTDLDLTPRPPMVMSPEEFMNTQTQSTDSVSQNKKNETLKKELITGETQPTAETEKTLKVIFDEVMNRKNLVAALMLNDSIEISLKAVAEHACKELEKKISLLEKQVSFEKDLVYQSEKIMEKMQSKLDSQEMELINFRSQKSFLEQWTDEELFSEWKSEKYTVAKKSDNPSVDESYGFNLRRLIQHVTTNPPPKKPNV